MRCITSRVFWLFVTLVIIVVFIASVFSVGSKTYLGVGELKTVYTTKDGIEHFVYEEEMTANVFSFIHQIKDTKLREEWLMICNEQFSIPRDDNNRYFYVMPIQLNAQIRDQASMGVSYEDPRPGCITLLFDEVMLTFPHLAQNPEGAAILCEISLVHELSHIRDWKTGQLDALIEYKEAAVAGLVETELPYDTAMQSRVEMFIGELRAISLECQYIQNYRQEDWFANVLPAEPVGRDIYLAWQNGQTDEFCSLVYDEYQKYFFPENWAIDDSDLVEMKAWMISKAKGGI